MTSYDKALQFVMRGDSRAASVMPIEITLQSSFTYFSERIHMSLAITPDPAASIIARRRLLATSALAFMPAALLSACGGGESDPPSIALYSTITGGAVGTAFSLSADADDDDGIKKVEFFRVKSGSEELLITFTAKPYLYQTTIPTGTAGTTIEYRARVTDSDDQTTDSNKISITVST
jgi:Bacterial Ig domain